MKTLMIFKNKIFEFLQLIHAISIGFYIYSGQTFAQDNPAIDLNVEDLLKIKVTSVSKKVQTLNDAPSAIFVITNEDIRRSGATSIPDALRMAPGLEVGRINAGSWAISSRGFNSRWTNKLQVLIDGRSLYNRSFGGIDWENQDVLLEDVERIEVIRGPGAALWGANAVNGVINIITKSSSDTQGAQLNAGAGSFEQGFGSIRYGGRLSENTTARAYVLGFERGPNHIQPEASGHNLTQVAHTDEWNKQQGGFRLDSRLNARDEFTLQGDVYNTSALLSGSMPSLKTLSPQNSATMNRAVGGNLLGRYQHTTSPTSEYRFQFYYDGFFHDLGIPVCSRNTLDLDFQHRFMMTDNQELIWGGNYRFGADHLDGTDQQKTFFTTKPTVRDQLFSAFVQDEISLIENTLKLTTGLKLEHNDYSGFEGQPSTRLMWTPHNDHRIWAGISRSVRTPSRGEQAMRYLSWTGNNPQSPLPLAIYWQGDPNFKAESVISYETGYRTTAFKSISLDITGFYNENKDINHIQALTPSLDPSFRYIEQILQIRNQYLGHSYGMESSISWQMLDWWRWDINYSWLYTPFLYTNGDAVSPKHHASIRGIVSPHSNLDLDLWLRYVDKNLESTSFGLLSIPSYLTMDLRAAWRPQKNLELSITGQNLLQSSHLEFVSDSMFVPTAIVRGVYGKISWKF